MKKVLIAALIGFVAVVGFSGCKTQETKASAAPAKAAKSEAQVMYEAAHKMAKAEMKKAKAAGGLWRDTGKVLKKAEKAAKKGEYHKAKKLAQRAIWEGKRGQAQAKEQANVGNPGYLY